jgi:hypothetical protein
VANRSSVQAYVTKALEAGAAEEKLDELARAIDQLALYVTNVETKLLNEIYHVQNQLRQR